MTEELFSVYQYFADGTYECVRDHVDAESAVRAAHHYVYCVGAQIGTTVKVQIVNGDDDTTSFLWEFGKGIVYPHRQPDGTFVGD